MRAGAARSPRVGHAFGSTSGGRRLVGRVVQRAVDRVFETEARALTDAGVPQVRSVVRPRVPKETGVKSRRDVRLLAAALFV